MRILVGDKTGKLLGELDAEIRSMTTALNEIGGAELAVSTSDSKANEDYLGIGNRIYVEMDNGLPPWGGVLDTPRVWSQGIIEITCYTIEHLYQYRVTGKNESYYERQAGQIFQILVEHEEEKDPLGVTIGEVWKGGRPHYPRYHYRDLWYIFNYSLLNMELCEFTFTPYLSNGYIKFRADFKQLMGEDKSASVSLIENRNVVADTMLEEQGNIINQFYAIGDGSTWDEDRKVQVGLERQSRAKYGLRQASRIHAGVTYRSTLEMHVRNELKLNSEPRRIFKLSAVNQEPGTFASYKLGDIVRCELASFGFDGYRSNVRITAREYHPDREVCDLVVEEPRYPDYWIYEDEREED